MAPAQKPPDLDCTVPPTFTGGGTLLLGGVPEGAVQTAIATRDNPSIATKKADFNKTLILIFSKILYNLFFFIIILL